MNVPVLKIGIMVQVRLEPFYQRCCSTRHETNLSLRVTVAMSFQQTTHKELWIHATGEWHAWYFLHSETNLGRETVHKHLQPARPACNWSSRLSLCNECMLLADYSLSWGTARHASYVTSWVSLYVSVRGTKSEYKIGLDFDVVQHIALSAKPKIYVVKAALTAWPAAEDAHGLSRCEPVPLLSLPHQSFLTC